MNPWGWLLLCLVAMIIGSAFVVGVFAFLRQMGMDDQKDEDEKGIRRS